MFAQGDETQSLPAGTEPSGGYFWSFEPTNAAGEA